MALEIQVPQLNDKGWSHTCTHSLSGVTQWFHEIWKGFSMRGQDGFPPLLPRITHPSSQAIPGRGLESLHPEEERGSKSAFSGLRAFASRLLRRTGSTLHFPLPKWESGLHSLSELGCWKTSPSAVHPAEKSGHIWHRIHIPSHKMQ